MTKESKIPWQHLVYAVEDSDPVLINQVSLDGLFSVFGCCFFAIAWLHITEQTERTFTSKRRHNAYQYRHSVLANSQDWHCLRNLRPACQQKIWNQCSIEDSFRTGIDIMFPLSAKSVHIPEITVASPTETIWKNPDSWKPPGGPAVEAKQSKYFSA